MKLRLSDISYQKFVNNNPLWVKTIDREGRVSPVNWYDVYTKLRQETGTLYPG